MNEMNRKGVLIRLTAFLFCFVFQRISIYGFALFFSGEINSVPFRVNTAAACA
jgi:hypothetical protein